MTDITLKNAFDAKPAFYTFHGLPGSGKSTLAAKFQMLLKSAGIDAPIVNLDNIRTEVAGDSYHSGNPQKEIEKKVAAIRNERISDALSSIGRVISDDTNLNPRTVRSNSELARAAGAVIIHVFVDLPVRTAFLRNDIRGSRGGRRVPGFVIEGMAKSYYMDDKINREPILAEGDLVLDMNLI